MANPTSIYEATITNPYYLTGVILPEKYRDYEYRGSFINSSGTLQHSAKKGDYSWLGFSYKDVNYFFPEDNTGEEKQATKSEAEPKVLEIRKKIIRRTTFISGKGSQEYYKYYLADSGLEIPIKQVKFDYDGNMYISYLPKSETLKTKVNWTGLFLISIACIVGMVLLKKA